MRKHAAEIIAALMKGPRTVGELGEYLYDGKHADGGVSQAIGKWMADFHSAGVVRIAGKKRRKGHLTNVWALQAKVYGEPDTPEAML